MRLAELSLECVSVQCVLVALPSAFSLYCPSVCKSFKLQEALWYKVLAPSFIPAHSRWWLLLVLRRRRSPAKKEHMSLAVFNHGRSSISIPRVSKVIPAAALPGRHRTGLADNCDCVCCRKLKPYKLRTACDACHMTKVTTTH